ALEKSLDDLDGFFNFVVGTKEGFGVVRDPIACKPAVMAETDDYVAFGSEYRALAGLPGIDKAKVWEPEPATVYFWQRDGCRPSIARLRHSATSIRCSMIWPRVPIIPISATSTRAAVMPLPRASPR